MVKVADETAARNEIEVRRVEGGTPKTRQFLV